jgi:uncharacterized protein (DUF58 family)
MKAQLPLGAMRKHWRMRWERWLDKRVPPSDSMRFDHRNVFVFPTDTGFAFAMMVILVFLCGVNYSNALILGFCFLLVSTGIVSIHLSFLSLAGASVEVVDTTAAFVGDAGSIKVRIRAGKRDVPLLRIRCRDSQELSVPAGQWRDVTLPVTINKRGRNSSGRILIETTWPFSWIRCWTWWIPQTGVAGFPSPEPHALDVGAGHAGNDDAIATSVTDEQPDELREWRAGDPLSRIAWKASLRIGALQIRHTEATASRPSMVNVGDMPGPGLERRYSQAAFIVLSASSRGDPVGVKTPAGAIEPASGPLQLEQCMMLLALSESH